MKCRVVADHVDGKCTQWKKGDIIDCEEIDGNLYLDPMGDGAFIPADWNRAEYVEVIEE